MPDIITPAVNPPAPPAQADKVRARQIVIDLPAGGVPTVRVLTEAVTLNAETGAVIDRTKPPEWLPAEFPIDPSMHPEVVAAVHDAVIHELLLLRPAWYARESAVRDQQTAEYQALLDQETAKADAAAAEADNLRAAVAARNDQINALRATISALDPEQDAGEIAEAQAEIANHQQAITALESLAGQHDSVASNARRSAETCAASLALIAKSRADLDAAFANDPFELR